MQFKAIEVLRIDWSPGLDEELVLLAKARPGLKLFALGKKRRCWNPFRVVSEPLGRWTAMREIGVITGDDPHDGLTLARWEECAAGRPQDLQGPDNFTRWRLTVAGACVGQLDFIEDGRRGGPGYLVVAAVRGHERPVSMLAEALADGLGARFRRCSARFSEVEGLVEQFGTRPVEIEFVDGRTALVATDYCSLTRDEERVYYYNLDPSLASFGEGLCFTRIASIRSIRASDLHSPEGGS
jgi:hypothetical protein